MTTRTAAERAQEFEDWWRGLQEDDPPESMKEAAAIAWCWMRAQRDTLRAALAPPQEGEVEECADRLEAMAEGYSAEAAKFFRNAARLLRATQSTNMTPTAVAGSPSALSERPASSELLEATATPAQSAPAQEPVAQWWGVIDADNDVVIAFKHRHAANEHINVGLDKFMDDPEAFAEIKQWRLAPLYAAPPPDEARELLDEAILYVRGDAESGYEDAVQLHERIRAYLEKHK